MLSLRVSDANKQLLLTNQNFLPHLVSGLLFDATTAPVLLRADFEPIKASVQRDYAECLQQVRNLLRKRFLRISTGTIIDLHIHGGGGVVLVYGSSRCSSQGGGPCSKTRV